MSIRGRYRRWRVVKAIRKARRVLRFIDKMMDIHGMPKWKRQQIRRDIITSDKAWIDFVDMMDTK